LLPAGHLRGRGDGGAGRRPAGSDPAAVSAGGAGRDRATGAGRAGLADQRRHQRGGRSDAHPAGGGHGRRAGGGIPVSGDGHHRRQPRPVRNRAGRRRFHLPAAHRFPDPATDQLAAAGRVAVADRPAPAVRRRRLQLAAARRGHRALHLQRRPARVRLRAHRAEPLREPALGGPVPVRLGGRAVIGRGKATVVVAVLGLAACSSKTSLTVTCASSQTCAAALAGVDAGLADGAPAALGAFTPPSDPGSGGILFTASGEAAATQGVAFPPASAGAAAFVDGWSVRFTRVLVTLDNLTLSAGPNVSPGDESCTEPAVAKETGPWAVDLARPGDRTGKGGGGERAVAIAALSGDFDTSGATPYAFGYDVIPAATSARNVNLDDAGLVDYARMVTDGCTVLYVGTATFNGTSCTCPTPADPTRACADLGPGWPQLGDSVPFRFCFKSPTSYVNCQNPDNGGEPLAGEEAQRGIYFQNGSSVIAQVTIHLDHPFWDSVLHDTPAHFDSSRRAW